MDRFLIAIGMLCFGISMGALIVGSTNKNSDLEYGFKIASGRYLKNVNFKDHSYIHLRNTWDSAGDQFIHDPSCSCHRK